MSRYELTTKDGGTAAIGYDAPCQTYFWFKYPKPNVFGAVMCTCYGRRRDETMEQYSARIKDIDGEFWCEHQDGAPTVMEGAMPRSMTKNMLIERCVAELTDESLRWLKSQGHWHKLCMDLPF